MADPGLIVVVVMSVFTLVMVVASVLVVILTCVVMKRRSKLAQESESSEMVTYSQVNPVSDQTEEGPYYSLMETQPTTSKNEAYGKLTQDASTDVDTYDYVNDPSNNTADLDTNDPPTMNNEAYETFTGATITAEVYADIDDHYNCMYDNPSNDPTIQNTACGDIPSSTTTNDDEDYYVNEGMNETRKAYSDVPTTNVEPNCEGLDNVLSGNEAYGDTTRQGPANDSSIPTTENEAYTSVSANTDGMDTEETYDYVRNL